MRLSWFVVTQFAPLALGVRFSKDEFLQNPVGDVCAQVQGKYPEEQFGPAIHLGVVGIGNRSRNEIPADARIVWLWEAFMSQGQT
jgi:hypothetical protein